MSKLLEKINTAERKFFKLEELFEVGPQYGYTESANKEKVGPKFLRITDIKGNVVNWDTVPYCKISENEKDKYLLKKDDLVFARTGATTGMSYFVNSNLTEDTVFASYLIRLRFNEKKCFPDLLKYFFQSRNYWGQVNGSLSGSAQPGINAVVLSEMQVKLPIDLATQKKIAGILSAYDEKIENNNKIIKNLETTAQTIFNEWFVNFKFPGHEKVKMVDCEIGEIPERWGVGKISDLGNVVCGKTPSKFHAEYFGGNIPFIKIPDMHDQVFINTTEDSLTEAGENTQKNKTVPAGSICVSCIATVGLVSITTQDSQTNQQINTLIPNSGEFLEYLYFTLVGMKSDLQAIGSGGSTTLNVNRSVFLGLEVLIPTTDSVTEFHKVVSRMFNQIKHLTTENISLKSQRDQLLAKLI